MTQLFKVGWRDLVKGAVLVVLVAVLTGLKAVLEAHGFSLTGDDLKEILSNGTIAFIGYILKNFLTDQNDKFIGVV